MPRKANTPTRETLTNWQGSPCPRCGSALKYRGDLPSPDGWVLVLLACERDHCWQERMNLQTRHSGVFVERREDLEREPRLRSRPAASQRPRPQNF